MDFTATTVIDVADVPANMLVTWLPARTDVFQSLSGAGVVLDLSGTGLLHHVWRGWVSTDLAGLGMSPRIVPNGHGKGVFAINLAGTVHMYFSFSAFENALSGRLATGYRVRHVAAHGPFVAGNATLTANAMSVLLLPPLP